MAAKKHSRLNSVAIATDGIGGTYNALNSLREGTFDQTKNLTDATTREDLDWTSTLNGLKSGSLTLNCAWDESDTVLMAIIDAYDGDTTLHARWRYDTAGGLRQARAEVQVASVSAGAPVDDTQISDITLQLNGAVTYDTQ